MIEGFDVVGHLGHVGHAGQHHGDVVKALQPPEAEGGDAVLRTDGVELLLTFGVQRRQLAAPDRLHDPQGDAPLLQQLVLLFAVLHGPVQEVELQLAELHLIAVAVQEVRQAGKIGMTGKAQVPDAALLLLLDEIVHDAPTRIVVYMYRVFIHVVQQIEVEVLHLALLQLLLKDVGGIIGLRHHVAGELGGQIEAVPGILFQAFAHHDLRPVLHIGPRGVVIIHPVFHGVVHHLLGLRRVDLAVFQYRQAHGAKAQHGKPGSLEVTVNHFAILPSI